MSGYSPYGNNPQYPQAPIYPSLANPANAPAPGQPPTMPNMYPAPGQNPQYPYQPAFSYQYQGQPPPPQYQGQPPPAHAVPAAMSYSGVHAAPMPSAPPTHYGFYPSVTPTPVSTVEWVPSNVQHAVSLTDRVIVGGYEGHDGSPLWVIRARYEGDLIPGKLAVKHHAAYVAWGGNENEIREFEVCCARPESVRWIESRDGAVPPNAVVGGNTSSGEPLYVGRAKHQGSLTPGKIHPSHKVIYISFAGKELPHKLYEVLCAA